jgi:hypothetical protein
MRTKLVILSVTSSGDFRPTGKPNRYGLLVKARVVRDSTGKEKYVVGQKTLAKALLALGVEDGETYSIG